MLQDDLPRRGLPVPDEVDLRGRDARQIRSELLLLSPFMILRQITGLAERRRCILVVHLDLAPV